MKSKDRSSPVPPSREGKVAITFWEDPEFRDSLKIAAINAGESVQDIIVRAVRGELRKMRGRAA